MIGKRTKPDPSEQFTIAIDADGKPVQKPLHGMTLDELCASLAWHVEERRQAQQLGKLGGAARARKLTPERRTQIATKGAAKRWGKHYSD
jgi:hypothetical protein